MTLHRFKMITKPFWVPAIASIYILAANKVDYLVLAALFFGWAGDLLLMRGRKSWFVAGAFSFLIGHLFYARVFIGSAGGLSVFAAHPVFCALILLPYILYLIFLKFFLGQNVKSVFYAAAFYLSFLMLMSYASLLRIWALPLRAFLPTFLGSILFIISDSLIAVRKFKRKFRGVGVVIVVTYIAAQLLIISGLV